MKYLIINKETNIAENAVAWDGDTTVWQPPETHYAVNIEGLEVGIGYSYIDGVFVPPNQPEPAVEVSDTAPPTDEGAETL